jgi:hypothetical protein
MPNENDRRNSHGRRVSASAPPGGVPLIYTGLAFRGICIWATDCGDNNWRRIWLSVFRSMVRFISCYRAQLFPTPILVVSGTPLLRTKEHVWRDVLVSHISSTFFLISILLKLAPGPLSSFPQTHRTMSPPGHTHVFSTTLRRGSEPL